jgi:16S rRNA (cytosine967-C5)-methyltransferase
LADPRLLAVRHVAAVLDGQSLDAALADLPEGVDERDRALAAELGFGVCRWYRRLDALIGRLLQRPLRSRDRDLHLLLLVAAYQLLYTRVPAHAAVSEAVRLTRQLGKDWAGGLVNGVLRGLQRRQAELEAAVDAEPAVRVALPDWLFAAVEQAWPAQRDAILAASQARAPMTLRLDLSRVDRAAYARDLAERGVASRPHATVDSALVLERAVPVRDLPGFEDGRVSVQDAGAQLAGRYLEAGRGQRVLDACAAPGGKTLDILQHTPDLRVVALDIDEGRLARVTQNLERAGLAAELAVGDAAVPANAPWGRERYDRILVDAPCSATGVLRRHPDIRLLRRAGDIGALARRQADILDALWSLLVPGGRLLYVTCSVLPVENDVQVAAFLERHADAVAADLPAHAGARQGHGIQLLPGVDDTDGFYYAALTKAATVTGSPVN